MNCENCSTAVARRSVSSRLAISLAVLAASAQVAAAAGNTGVNDGQSATVGANDATVTDAFSDTWKLELGAGAVNEARYPGSRYDFTRGLPFVSISYDRLFIGGGPGGGAPGIGAYLVHTEHWVLGLDVGGDTRKPRRATDDPVLRGWGDIPGTVHGGMFAGYEIDWLSVHGSVSVGGHHEGVLASLGIEAKYQATPRLSLSIGPEVTWVNSQYAMTFFGINAAQSQIAGLAPYRARSGIESVGGSAGARYVLTPHWSLAAHVSYGRLQGDAANSPVTTDRTQAVYSAFVIYRF